MLPHNIQNGDAPDATPLMANFNYLDALISNGSAIKTGLTMADLQTFAALTPAQVFLCVPTDMSAFLLYCGDVTAGAGGFITLSSWNNGGII